MNTLCSAVVFSLFCERQTAKDLVLPSLILCLLEPRQFGMGIFIFRHRHLSGRRTAHLAMLAQTV